MILQIDPDDPLAPVHQIVKQLTTGILTGALPMGSRLPTVRQLASDLGVANGTVAKAYRQLESIGYLEGKGRKGSYVTEMPLSIPLDEVDRQLEEKARDLVLTAAITGRDRHVVLSIIHRVFEQLDPSTNCHES